MKIQVIPYNPLWPDQYANARSAIARCLGDIVERTHHIGSTAVEWLPAKPIIDLMLEVRSLEALDEATPKLESIGYEAKGEFGISGRRYFRKGLINRTHQIHAFKSGDPHVFRHLAFRDYLRAHLDVQREYGDLKISLADTFPDNLDQYCEGKDSFIKYHEALAIEWSQGRGGL